MGCRVPLNADTGTRAVPHTPELPLLRRSTFREPAPRPDSTPADDSASVELPEPERPERLAQTEAPEVPVGSEAVEPTDARDVSDASDVSDVSDANDARDGSDAPAVQQRHSFRAPPP